MYQYLIGDYILGYSLSNDDPFSPAEIGEELHLPVGPVLRTFLKIHKLKGHWFKVTPGSSGGKLSITRNKEYDEEIILWLINGESKKLFKQIEVSKFYNKSIIRKLAGVYYYVSKRLHRKTLFP